VCRYVARVTSAYGSSTHGGVDDCLARVTQNVHRVRQDEAADHAAVKVLGFRLRAGQDASVEAFPCRCWLLWSGLLRAHRQQRAAARLQAGALWTDLDLVDTDGRATPHNRDRHGGRSTGA